MIVSGKVCLWVKVAVVETERKQCSSRAKSKVQSLMGRVCRSEFVGEWFLAKGISVKMSSSSASIFSTSEMFVAYISG